MALNKYLLNKLSCFLLMFPVSPTNLHGTQSKKYTSSQVGWSKPVIPTLGGSPVPGQPALLCLKKTKEASPGPHTCNLGYPEGSSIEERITVQVHLGQKLCQTSSQPIKAGHGGQ
jgi:hypothetical protein